MAHHPESTTIHRREPWRTGSSSRHRRPDCLRRAVCLRPDQRPTVEKLESAARRAWLWRHVGLRIDLFFPGGKPRSLQLEHRPDSKGDTGQSARLLDQYDSSQRPPAHSGSQQWLCMRLPDSDFAGIRPARPVSNIRVPTTCRVRTRHESSRGTIIHFGLENRSLVVQVLFLRHRGMML